MAFESMAIADTLKLIRQNLALDSATLGPQVVTSYNIKDLSIATGDIADSAVTTVKIADSAVTTVKINDSAVTTPKINNSAVTIIKIANNNVVDQHLSVTTCQSTGTAKAIGTGAITTYNNIGLGGVIQNGGLFTGGVNDRFTISRAGIYLITYDWQWGNNAVGERYFYPAQAAGGGAPVNFGIYDARGTTPAGVCGGSFARIAFYNVNDTIGCQCYQTSGGNLNITVQMGATFLTN